MSVRILNKNGGLTELSGPEVQELAQYAAGLKAERNNAVALLLKYPEWVRWDDPCDGSGGECCPVCMADARYEQNIDGEWRHVRQHKPHCARLAFNRKCRKSYNNFGHGGQLPPDPLRARAIKRGEQVEFHEPPLLGRRGVVVDFEAHERVTRYLVRIGSDQVLWSTDPDQLYPVENP